MCAWFLKNKLNIFCGYYYEDNAEHQLIGGYACEKTIIQWQNLANVSLKTKSSF